MSDSFPAFLAWKGDTTEASYGRGAELSKPEGQTAIPVSSIPLFGGDGSRWNPEDLIAGALSTCHMLTFLAIANKARVVVTGYQDKAETTLETVDRISRVGEIALRPVIHVAAGSDPGKVEELFVKAHKYCVIANSITAKVIMEPTVVVAS
jgi:organic hydroperoxide reductase OsmC/OhrA